jgi:BirA family transcriptional regulator, biotin operon repressor / biotin---[acetyl-CoA-carboxylase] ligase
VKTDNPEALAEKVLDKIRKQDGHPVERAKLIKSLKIKEDDLNRAVLILKSWGYSIKVDNMGQIIFQSAPDSLISTEISYKLKSKVMGREIHAFKSVQSTNTLAYQLAASGAPEGTLVVAEIQTKGRGRLGRSWHSPENRGIYFSLVLRPKIHPTKAPGISLISAIAVAETIAEYDNFKIGIKWPNDVLLSDLKVAGILTELSAELDRVNFVIVGIGINANHRRSDFPEDLRKSATSIRIESKKKIRRVDFLQKLLYNFEKEYLIFKKSGLEKSRKKILKYSSLLYTEVELKIGRKTVSGKVIDIDKLGRLVIETADGVESFNAGEVTMHRKTGRIN